MSAQARSLDEWRADENGLNEVPSYDDGETSYDGFNSHSDNVRIAAKLAIYRVPQRHMR